MDLHDPVAARHAATPGQLAWLTEQVRLWQAERLVSDETAERILGGYADVRRLSLGRLLLYLGGAFVGVGLIWLVAANLDDLAPLSRFLSVTTIWLGFVALAHVLGERRTGRGLRTASPVVGAFRGVAALAYGAVVFQAAQSLQVPAYEPALVGYWGAGALLYAYAVRGVTPLVVGLSATLGWFVWEVTVSSQSGLGVVLAFTLAAAVAAGVAVLHQRLLLPGFEPLWRAVGAVLVLTGLFVAAIPEVTVEDFVMSSLVWVGFVVAGLVALAGLVLGEGTTRFEPLAAAAVTGLAVILVRWDPGLPDTGGIGAEGWAHAALSVAVYVGVAGWVAALGVLRDSGYLTWIALVALVLFTTVQSFAVFAEIIEGAWLFVALGLVFIGSGFVFDRGRRELEQSLEAVRS
jgi:uncharacterized membrane protein